MLDPKRALAFLAVVETGSFAAAAHRLHLSPPAVSRAVSGLERSLGVPLLRRRREGVVPTGDGERLAARMRLVAAELRRAEAELTGRLRLGAFPTAARTFVPAALRAAGGVRVTLREIPGSAGAGLVADGALDLAIGFQLRGEPVPAPATVDLTPLRSEPLRLAVPAGHRLTGRVRLGDLAGEDWVQGAGEGAPRVVERACRRAGFEPRIAAEADTTQPLVAAGAGITLVPALGGSRPDVRVLDLEDPPVREVYAVTARQNSPRAAAVLEALRAAAA